MPKNPRFSKFLKILKIPTKSNNWVENHILLKKSTNHQFYMIPQQDLEDFSDTMYVLDPIGEVISTGEDSVYERTVGRL